MEFDKVKEHELWRCLSCRSVNEVISINSDIVKYIDRGTNNEHQSNVRIFCVIHERLTPDDVLIETGGIF